MASPAVSATPPSLYERVPEAGAQAGAEGSGTGTGTWQLWMSLAPQEVVTLWPLVPKARGRTAVLGLGMGWVLFEVLRRPVDGGAAG